MNGLYRQALPVTTRSSLIPSVTHCRKFAIDNEIYHLARYRQCHNGIQEFYDADVRNTAYVACNIWILSEQQCVFYNSDYPATAMTIQIYNEKYKSAIWISPSSKYINRISFLKQFLGLIE